MIIRVGLAVLLGASGAAGQQGADTVRLGEVVVTAARLPVRLADAPGTVTVLHGSALERRGVRTVVDALRTVPGVAVAQSGGTGGIASLFMRGGESDYVQVLVDGVQVNLPGGSFNWGHLRTEDIERIEIVRGPASVLYGSDAVAGVVQIFTRAGGQPQISVSAAGMRGDRPLSANGNHDTHAFDGAITGTTAFDGSRLDYGITAVRAGSTGLYDVNSDYDNTQLSGRLKLTGVRADAGITVRGSDNVYHYPTSGSGAVNDINQFATGATRSAGIDAGAWLTRGLELRMSAAVHDNDARTDDPDDGAEQSVFWSTATSMRRSAETRMNATLPRGLIATVGVEREWQDDKSAYKSVSTFGTFTDATDETRKNVGAFAQLHGSPARSFTTTLGARIDSNQQFGRFTTARAAASWRPLQRTRLHAALGNAFKEPTFFENYAVGFTVGNPTLAPEQSRSWEAGAEYGVTAVTTISATWFDQQFRNLIQYTASPVAGTPNYSNIGRASAHGAEFQVNTATRHVTIAAHYTFTRTRTQDAGFGEDPAFEQDGVLLRRPEHLAALSTTVNINSSLHINIDGRYSGVREDLDFTDPMVWSGKRVTLPSHATVDVGIGYDAIRYDRASVDIRLHVRNMLDEEYEEIFNFPAAGRVLELGLRAVVGK